MRDSKAAAGDLSGFLGEGTTISGDIRFPDILRVDGRITGKVSSETEGY